MKPLLLTTIAAVLLVGCGEAQQLAAAPEAIPPDSFAETEKQESSPELSNVQQDNWGVLTSRAPDYYASEDVPKFKVDLTKKWHSYVSEKWGNYGPVEIWIVGSDIKAVQKLDSFYDNLWEKRDKHFPFFREHSEFSFIKNFANTENASLNLHRDHQMYEFVISASIHEDDYLQFLFHEYFHVYQNAHIYSKKHSERDSRMLKNPWWSEGGAEYMAQLLYSRLKGVRPIYLREVMKRKLRPLKDLGDGESIKDIPYDDERSHIAYDLGAWFIAFIINKTSEKTYRINFYKDLNPKGFEGAFFDNFGSSSKGLLKEFHETFLRLSVNEKLKIIPLKPVAEYSGVYTLNYPNGYLNFNISEDGSLIVESSLGDKANGSWKIEDENLFCNAMFFKNITIIKAKININTYELNELTMDGNPAPIKKVNPDGVFLKKKIN